MRDTMNGIGASWKLILAGAVGVTALVAAHFAGEEPPAAEPAPAAVPASAPAPSPAAAPAASAQEDEADAPFDPSPVDEPVDEGSDKAGQTDKVEAEAEAA